MESQTSGAGRDTRSRRTRWVELGRVSAVTVFALFVATAEGRAQESPAPAASPPAGPSPPPAATAAPPPPPAPAPPDAPWRLAEAVGSPSWLHFGIDQRLRLEYLREDFRSTAMGDSHGFFLRTLIPVELRFAPLALGAEFEDSRAYWTGTTPMNTTLVDPVEILQAYARLATEGLFAEGDAVSLTLGRFTMDLGSRRLVARNEFRNTINAFTGLDAQWTSPDRHHLRAFVTMPVIRLPSDPTALEDDDIELDHENPDAIFYGAFYRSPELAARVQVEAYVFALQERDGPDAPSSTRQLATPGARVLRAPASGEVDFQVEAMVQAGTSHASTAAADNTRLRHLAGSVHASVGYRFDVATSPRLAVQYDYASGDRDPDDGQNGRFDPLFGARRFELGPTGIWGAIGRYNLHSPGLRLEVTPHRTFDAMAAYRPVWLASATDAWVAAALRDPTGSSGTFVGQQLEARLRWLALPRNLALELGAAYLVRGELAKNVMGGPARAPAYLYTQLTWTI